MTALQLQGETEDFGFAARLIVILAGMFEKKTGDDVFSYGREPISPQPTFDAEAYSPYAAAWKKFDKLQKEAKGARLGSLGSFGWRSFRLQCWSVGIPPRVAEERALNCRGMGGSRVAGGLSVVSPEEPVLTLAVSTLS